MPDADPRLALARNLAVRLAGAMDVTAVALGGSVATGAADAGSDIDLYVYADPLPDITARATFAAAAGAAPGAEIGNTFFEPGDEWRHAASGIDIDIMYRVPDAIADRIDAVLVRHEARLGHSTCLWHNVRTSMPLGDPSGWYSDLRARAGGTYPPALAQAIVTLNRAMMDETKNAWTAQLAAALDRGDVVSSGHRATAFLASYFDVLFAINAEPHPGEKRLLALAARLCPNRPARMDRDVRALLAAAGRGDPAALGHARALLDGLDPLLDGFRPSTDGAGPR